MNEFAEKFPCVMVVSIAFQTKGGWKGEPYGCVSGYTGELGHGIGETLDEYSGYVGDLFHDGAKLPSNSGVYIFTGFVEVCMVGGSDEPITFNGEFKLAATPKAT